MWEIIEDSPQSRAYLNSVDSRRYFYKFFPENLDKNIFFDYIIFNNKTAFITAEKNQPMGVLIDNSNIYQISKFIFNLIWHLLPEPKALK